MSGARELGSLVIEARSWASVTGGEFGESLVAWTAASLEFPPAAIRYPMAVSAGIIFSGRYCVEGRGRSDKLRVRLVLPCRCNRWGDDTCVLVCYKAHILMTAAEATHQA